jgi:hypothetical protein
MSQSPTKQGQVQHIRWLPRDISLGNHNAPKGALLQGWCEISGTRQLWESLGDGRAFFVGYICPVWSDR